MKILKAEFGNCAAENITPEQIEAWLAGRTEWTLATRNRYLALLKLIFRLARKRRRSNTIPPASPVSRERTTRGSVG
jgi:hypothetical protein